MVCQRVDLSTVLKHDWIRAQHEVQQAVEFFMS